MARLAFGPQTTGNLDDASRREWLVADGLGGFAMGTVAGMRTRRYHGLLVVATEPPIGRHLALAALDAVVVIGDRRHELATHEWASGTVAPHGHRLMSSFELRDGVPRWEWSIGTTVVALEVAMTHGRPSVTARWELVQTPHHDVRLELSPLCTWRDVHGERRAGDDPAIDQTVDGFVFEGAYRVSGPGFEPAGEWYRGVHHREEAARGLTATEDLFRPGRFVATLCSGQSCAVQAWVGALDDAPVPAAEVIHLAKQRAVAVARTAGALDEPAALLAHAADQMIVRGASGPTVVAGYPWFGDWSRDTMTSYEGLFLATGRADEGAELLRAAAASVSQGMLANTADAGGTEYNTVDAAMWFLHAVGRHVEQTRDAGLGVDLLPAIDDIVEHDVRGTRFGIRVDDDGLITQGADGWALTWMDARVDGVPVTQRTGKPVEVAALWVEGLGVAVRLAGEARRDASRFARLHDVASASFERRFVRPDGGGLFDVVDGPGGDEAAVRPNQVIAAALQTSLLSDGQRQAVAAAIEPLATPLGLRSLSPVDSAYLGAHRGSPAERDRAYHQGTVWPWLAGPWVDVLCRTGRLDAAQRVVAALDAHLGEWGLGSVSETLDGEAPHDGTGCPFQAWSVAGAIRARRTLGAHQTTP